MIRTLEGILQKNINEISLEKGKELVRKNLVKEVTQGEAFGAYNIDAKVDSEYGNSTYTTKIVVDLAKEDIRVSYCNCMDYERHYLRGNRKYLCKHLSATFIKNNKIIKEKEKKKKIKKSTRANNLGYYLLEEIESKKYPKERVNLDVSITRRIGYKLDNIELELKIGRKRMYVLKSIEDFVKAMEREDKIEYGKEFVYSPKDSYFSKEDEKLLDFIKEYVSIGDKVNEGSYGRNTLLSGKTLRVANTSFKTLLKSIIGKSIEFKIDDKIYKCEVLENDVPVKLLLGEDKDGLYIKRENELPIKVTDIGDVYFYGGILYLISKKQEKSLNIIYSYLEDSDIIHFKREDSTKVFNLLMPELQVVSNEFTLEDRLAEKIIREEPEFKFYFDKKDGFISCDLKIIYGSEEIDLFRVKDNGKYIIRNIIKEDEIINKLEELKFYRGTRSFIFDGHDEEMYFFLVRGAIELGNFGELFYSESFKNYNIRRTPSIKAEIIEKDRGFLEVDFKIEGVDEEEGNKILLALRNNKKFFKLKDESFLDLEKEEFKEIFFLANILSEDENLDTNFKIHRNKAFFLKDELIKGEFIKYEGKEILAEITNKLDSLDSLDYSVPKGLKSILRDYQITGFKWLKTLSYLGFGGILADEMGLGKTLQTIAFLLSEEGKKSLIVTPTSLIYNWENEFKRFAPSLRVGIIHGIKKHRIDLINTYKDYDVILTTYGTLRNDVELYKEKEFDYCIIDEGQNIKNPSAQNTETVKEIKSEVRFALTGTPIENSLMELWSIFDFVMPGYLFSRKKFHNKFISENNINLLKSLIRPFILRRLKNDVIKELPDKIEKKFYVDLSKEQKKIYKIVAEKAKDDFKKLELDNNRILVLSALTKLRQICLDPSIVIEDYKGGSGKIDVVLELLEGYVESGDKILLFSQFTSLLKIISDYLDKASIGYYYLDGSTKASERIELVNSFNKEEDRRIFLISLKAGGSGLNLTSANVVIHFDPWWNPAIEEQASDRAHRLGQKKVVQVIKLIAKGTIEEKIVELQEEKKELIDEVVNGEYTDGAYMTKVTTSELIKLIE